jgi:hypothetical protein
MAGHSYAPDLKIGLKTDRLLLTLIKDELKIINKKVEIIDV